MAAPLAVEAKKRDRDDRDRRRRGEDAQYWKKKRKGEKRDGNLKVVMMPR